MAWVGWNVWRKKRAYKLYHTSQLFVLYFSVYLTQPRWRQCHRTRAWHHQHYQHYRHQLATQGLIMKCGEADFMCTWWKVATSSLKLSCCLTSCLSQSTCKWLVYFVSLTFNLYVTCSNILLMCQFTEAVIFYCYMYQASTSKGWYWSHLILPLHCSLLS